MMGRLQLRQGSELALVPLKRVTGMSFASRGGPLAMLFVIVGLGVASPALACPQLSPAKEARNARIWQDTLAGSRKVRGRYAIDPALSSPSDYEATNQFGMIVTANGKIHSKTVIHNMNEIRCGVRGRKPALDQEGLFYLRREKGGRYRIVHFVANGDTE